MKKTTKIILICLLGILLCLGLYYLFDVIWNGSFVDWFEQHYMITHQKYVADVGHEILVTEPDWANIKILILSLLCISVVVLILLILIISHFYAKSQVKKSITNTSHMLHDFMVKAQGATDIFPKEYAEISAQMIEIKATIERHEQTLKEENVRKNDLIAYLAHDLKTPLTSIIGYLSLLSEAADMPDMQRNKYISIALHKSHRLEKLINEFFEITRYNLGKMELEKETIDLYYMLVQMKEEFYPLLNSHGNWIELNLDENIFIYGDSIKLARVFNNILKNAIAYSYPNTVITSWTENTDTEIKIYFQNKGKTIPKQKLNSIFEKFYRLDEARTTNTGGAGLGLAIAKEIVVLHGGIISADSENELTTFCVSLPLHNN